MRGGWKGVAGAALMLAGCGARSGPDMAMEVVGAGGGAGGGIAGAGASDTSGGGAIGSGGSSGVVTTGACPSRDLGSSLGAPAAEGVLAGSSSYSTLCGGSGPEARLRWRAPVSGQYRFDTAGSETSTLLSIAAAPCATSDQRCARGSAGLSGVRLAANELVELVVDTDGAGGGYLLDVLGPLGDPSAPCPAVDLGSGLGHAVWVGRLEDLSASMDVGCHGMQPAAAAAAWRAPHAGTFAFDASGSTFDTALDVQSGRCGGSSLGCGVFPTGSAPRLDVPLASGQIVVVWIYPEPTGRPPVAGSVFLLNVTESPGG